MDKNWCKHYTGIPKKVCSAGVDYDLVKDASKKPFEWKCTCPTLTVECEHHVLPTAAEVREYEELRDVYVADMLEAWGAIKQKHGKQSGVRGEIECPRCHGPLRYSISSYNGHVHGQCNTAGCLAWME